MATISMLFVAMKSPPTFVGEFTRSRTRHEMMPLAPSAAPLAARDGSHDDD
jgi:hypothetical protein